MGSCDGALAAVLGGDRGISDIAREIADRKGTAARSARRWTRCEELGGPLVADQCFGWSSSQAYPGWKLLLLRLSV